MTEPSIFTRINAGEFDEQLVQLAEALTARRKAVRNSQALENKSAMKPGDRVVITEGISPKYLVGTTGTVSERPARRKGDVQVDIDERYVQARQRFGPSVGVPASSLRVLTQAS
jgi:hypothetical protein